MPNVGCLRVRQRRALVVSGVCSYPSCSTEDVAMRNYDFTPLWRSSIGFDRLFDLINSQIPENQDGYPPYDIVRTGEDSYRISLAIAGFSPDDVAITAQQNLLTVSGRKTDNPDHAYIYQGVLARAFERRFSLADHV